MSVRAAALVPWTEIGSGAPPESALSTLLRAHVKSSATSSPALRQHVIDSSVALNTRKSCMWAPCKHWSAWAQSLNSKGAHAKAANAGPCLGRLPCLWIFRPLEACWDLVIRPWLQQKSQVADPETKRICEAPASRGKKMFVFLSGCDLANWLLC